MWRCSLLTCIKSTFGTGDACRGTQARREAAQTASSIVASDDVRGGDPSFTRTGIHRCPSTCFSETRITDTQGTSEERRAVTEQERGAARGSQPWHLACSRGKRVCIGTLCERLVVNDVVGSGWDRQRRDGSSARIGLVN